MHLLCATLLAGAGAGGCTESIPVWQLDKDTTSSPVDADVAVDTHHDDDSTLPFDTGVEDTFVPTTMLFDTASTSGTDTGATFDTSVVTDTSPPTTSVTDSSLGTSPLGDTAGNGGDSAGAGDTTR